MEKKYEIDMLNKNSVSVKTQNYVSIDGIDYDLGLPHRKAYSNSTRGRVEISSELPEPYLSAVLTIWGNGPVVDDLV